LIVKVNPARPAVAAVGLKLVIAGNGRVIVNVAAGDVPAKVVTVTLSGPELAIDADGMTTVNSVVETNVAVSAVVPTVTFDPVTKFAPFTVSANAMPPCTTEFGVRPVIAGIG
jgi:hypothetical protein